jgi:hypothetical protein
MIGAPRQPGMVAQPPALPARKNLRLAGALNAFLPGAGLFYLGRRIIGATLAAAFLACFLSMMTIFLVGYARYLSIAMSENLLEGNKLEEAGAAFHQKWLIGLALAGGGIYVCSTVFFGLTKRQLKL